MSETQPLDSSLGEGRHRERGGGGGGGSGREGKKQELELPQGKKAPHDGGKRKKTLSLIQRGNVCRCRGRERPISGEKSTI